MFNIKLSKILLYALCLCGALGFSQANITVSKAHLRYFEKNGTTWIPIRTNYLPIQNFEEAEKLLKEADEALLSAHNVQTEIIQAEVSGEAITPSVLFVHSQDHLMTAIEAKTLIEGMIRMYRRIDELEKK